MLSLKEDFENINKIKKDQIINIYNNKIKCSNLKINKLVLFDYKIWQIIKFNKTSNINIKSFIIFNKYTNLKKEFIFHNDFLFNINIDGFIILPNY